MDNKQLRQAIMSGDKDKIAEIIEEIEELKKKIVSEAERKISFLDGQKATIEMMLTDGTNDAGSNGTDQ